MISRKKQKAPKLKPQKRIQLLLSGENLERILSYARVGIPLKTIAELEKVSYGSLKNHLGEQIEHEFSKANAKVANALFHNATAKNNLGAQIFWLKCRAGWKDYSDDANGTRVNVFLAPAGPRASVIATTGETVPQVQPETILLNPKQADAPELIGDDAEGDDGAEHDDGEA